MATGIGPAAGEANSLRLQPPPALIGAVPLTAGRDDSTREEDAVGVGERAPGGDAAHDPRARASEGDSGDLPVSGPLAGADQRGDGGDPSRPFDYSGSTQTLPAVSRLRVTSRSTALMRIVLPIRSTSTRVSRVPGTRFRSCR